MLVEIPTDGVAAESNTIRIGQVQTRTFIKGISGVAIAGAAVVVNANDQLGVAPFSADFKHEIRPMCEESEVILAFKPVSFCYDQDIDEHGLPQFGLVAEDVEKVNPDLVLRNEEGKPYTVRYEAVNAMLLNEFLKEHRKVQKLEATVTQQQENFQSKLAQQQKQISPSFARVALMFCVLQAWSKAAEINHEGRKEFAVAASLLATSALSSRRHDVKA